VLCQRAPAGIGQGMAVGAFNHAMEHAINGGMAPSITTDCPSCPAGITFKDLSPSLQMAIMA
jgi:hypothetical protein